MKIVWFPKINLKRAIRILVDIPVVILVNNKAPTLQKQLVLQTGEAANTLQQNCFTKAKWNNFVNQGDIQSVTRS